MTGVEISDLIRFLAPESEDLPTPEGEIERHDGVVFDDTGRPSQRLRELNKLGLGRVRSEFEDDALISGRDDATLVAAAELLELPLGVDGHRQPFEVGDALDMIPVTFEGSVGPWRIILHVAPVSKAKHRPPSCRHP